jgi:hypothetical protein
MTVNPAKYMPNLSDQNGKHPRCVVCFTLSPVGVVTELDEPVTDMDDALCAEHSDTEFTDE